MSAFAPDLVDNSDDCVNMYWITSTRLILVDRTFTLLYAAPLLDRSPERRQDCLRGAGGHQPKQGHGNQPRDRLQDDDFSFWKPLVASTLKVTGNAKDTEIPEEGTQQLLQGTAAGCVPLYKEGDMVCGTARNLEIFLINGRDSCDTVD